MLENRPLYLVAKSGALAPAGWRISPGASIVIGRDAQCDVVLDDAEVSRNHARLTFRAGSVEVEDTGSSNGIFVDGKRVGSARLSPGMELRIGSTRLMLTAQSAPASGGQAVRSQRFVVAWSKRGGGDARSSRRVEAGSIVSLGRNPACDIVLDEATVSRQHAELHIRDDRIRVRSVTANGTVRIDGEAITDADWTIGQDLRIGPFDFRLVVEDAAPGDAANPAGEPLPQTRRPRSADRPEAALGKGRQPPLLRLFWRPRQEKWLDLEEEKGQWQSLEIKGRRHLLIGKDRLCDVSIDDPLVSHRHARITFGEDGVRVEDLDSTNGTKLGGLPIKQQTWRADQILDVGSFSFVIRALDEDGSYDRELTADFLGHAAPTEVLPRGQRQLRIFLSYSRMDLAIAERLHDELERKKFGFDVMMDRSHLPYGEEWQRELQAFIRVADTVLFLVSEHSVTSQWCAWELAQVKARTKRLFPIAVSQVDIASLPSDIARVQMLPSQGVFDFARDVPVLVKALNTNSEWIWQHTRFYDRALHWMQRGKPKAMLLRGVELKHARELTRTVPRGERISGEVLDLIDRSVRASRTQKAGYATTVLLALAVTTAIIWVWPEIQSRLEKIVERVVTKEKVVVDPKLSAQNAELWKLRSEFLAAFRFLHGQHGLKADGDRFAIESDVLFDSGRADLKPAGLDDLNRIASVMKHTIEAVDGRGISLDWVIQINGHTDKVPISTPAFPSNLELSLARARAVLKHLASQKVPEQRLVAAGHGEHQPIDAGSSAEALAKNRRIEIKITTR